MSDPLDDALKHLPHGPEFRFVDRLLSLEPGQSGLGEYVVRGDEPFLRGHFPDEPLFPGVLLVEAGAQMAGIVAQSDPARSPLPNLKLTAIRSIKITGTARPGDHLRIEASILGRMANLIQAHLRATVGDALLLEGEVTLSGSLRLK